MKRRSTEGLTPKLRFPEFRKAPGWTQHKLGELFSQREETGCTGLRLLSLTDAEGIIPQEDSGRKNNASVDRSKYLRVVPGDIAYNTMRMWEGRSARATIEGLVSPAYTVCRPNDGTDSLFFSYYFKTHQLIEEFARYSQGLVKDTLNLKCESFARISTATPPFPEQHRIASCLSSLDDLITAERQKLDALKAHKKGLMQQLFPRKGETRPRLRFPEFQNAPAWEEKNLGDILQITSSKRVHESEWTATGVPFYRAREIVALSKQEAITPLYISEDLYSANITLSGEISAGHLLVTGVGSIGVPYLVREGDRFYFKDGNIVWLKNDGRELLGEFLLRLYETDVVQSQIRKMADVGTVATYTIDNAKRTTVAFPSNKAEQHRIASFLSSLDDLITAQGVKLEALKTHKKGLMQQLFPAPEEAGV